MEPNAATLPTTPPPSPPPEPEPKPEIPTEGIGQPIDTPPVPRPQPLQSPSESPPTATSPLKPQAAPSARPNPLGMGQAQLSQRLNTAPEIIASDPERAAKIATQADANLPQEPPLVDNGVGMGMHYAGRFAAGGAAGVGAVAKGLTLLPAGISMKAQSLEQMTLAGIAVFDQNKDNPDWNPNDLLVALLKSGQNKYVVDTLAEYWGYLKNGDLDSAQSLRAELEANVQSRIDNRSFDPTSYGLWETGQSLQDLGEEQGSFFYGNSLLRDHWTSQVTYGLGYAVPVIAATGTASVIGGPAGTATVAAMIGTSIGGSSEYDRAIAEGATPEEAMDAAKWGGLVGLATSVSFGGTPALGVFMGHLRSQAGRAIEKTLYELVKDLPEGVAVGVIALVASNLAAQGIYNPERGFLDGAGEQMKGDAVSSISIYAFLGILGLKVKPSPSHHGGTPHGSTPTNPTPGETILAELDANSKPGGKKRDPAEAPPTLSAADLQRIAQERRQNLQDDFSSITTSFDSSIYDKADKLAAIDSLPPDLPDLAVPLSSIDQLEAAKGISAADAAALRQKAVNGVVPVPQKTMLSALVSMDSTADRATILGAIDYPPSNATPGQSGAPNSPPANPLASTLTTEAERALDTRLKRDRPLIAALPKADRDYYLDLEKQGHGPQRHDGEVTTKALQDRLEKGIDPMTGTVWDGVHIGKTHRPPKREATRFKTPQDFIAAEKAIRGSTDFQNKLNATLAIGKDSFKVENFPLAQALGPNYLSKLEGLGWINPKNKALGTRPTNFTDGTVTAIFKIGDNGEIKLHTMFANPK